MGVVIDGLDDLERKLAEAERRYRGAADRFLKQQAELLLGRVRDNTPVDTSTLRSGWARTQPHNNMIDVYNNTEYAAHVEYGHRIPIMKNGDFVRNKKGNKRYKKKTVPGVKMLRKSVRQQKAMFRENAKAILEAMFK